jgi:sulfur relay protein TusB/DsrH
MSALHTIHNANGLAAALARSGDDPLLLLEDGVYLADQIAGRKVFVLREDLAARGLPEPAGLTLLGMQEFVALAVQHAPIVAWY